jgi:NADPH:quinone reductase-like Zn-dependent oxidoreductase
MRTSTSPGPGEVLVRMEASPINPSDLLFLLAGGDGAGARLEGSPERPRAIAPIPPAAARALAGRVDQPIAVGGEGAGTVIAAGEGAQALLGKRAALLTLGRGTFGQYLTVPASSCEPLPEGTTAAEGADVFVNPLTALAMVETARREGHPGIAHTAAASNLGQMLVKLCQADGIPLVNIVRRPEQVELLKQLGAAHVCDSSAPTFREDLVRAFQATCATVCFDAVGGGRLASQVLSAMEAAAVSRARNPSPFGSTERKTVYVYGRLDRTPQEISPPFGQFWNVSGWVMTAFMEAWGPECEQRLRRRAVEGLKSIFASHYVREISLAEALQPEIIAAYGARATGGKHLINPTL